MASVRPLSRRSIRCRALRQPWFYETYFGLRRRSSVLLSAARHFTDVRRPKSGDRGGPRSKPQPLCHQLSQPIRRISSAIGDVSLIVRRSCQLRVHKTVHDSHFCRARCACSASDNPVIGIFRGRDTKVGLDQRADKRSSCGTGKLQTRRDSRSGKCGIHQPPRVARHSLSHGGVHGHRQIRTVPSYLVSACHLVGESGLRAGPDRDCRCGARCDRRGAAGRHRRSVQSGTDRKGPDGDDGQSGAIQDHRPASGDI